VERLDTRTEALQKHFDQAAEDVRQIRISSEKISRGIEKVENVELGEPADAPRLAANAR
jgi:DNA recombination protein RmuC